MTDNESARRGWERGRGWGWIWGPDDEQGALNAVTPDTVLAALALVSRGRVYDLGVTIDRESFLWNGHVGTEVVTFRSPAGLLAERGAAAPDDLTFRTSMVVLSDHAGSQIDALSHAMAGAPPHWYNGFDAATHMTDFGVTRAGGEAIPPIVARGVLLDVAAHLGVEELAPGFAIEPDLLAATARSQGTEFRVGDVVLVRSGTGRHWGDYGHDREALARSDGSGITLASARWLVEQHGAAVIGSDTSTVEVIPAVDGDCWQPVHRYLLVEQGVHLAELHLLEELSRDRTYEFCYVALTPKVRGTTAGFALRPIALA